MQRPLVGVVVPWLPEPNHLKIVDGFRQVMSDHGYDVLTLQSGFARLHGFANDLLTDGAYEIARERAAGWMVLNLTGIDAWAAAQAARGLAVVQVSPDIVAPGCQRVAPDNVGGARAAVEHLIGHGHTRIAFIGHLANRDIAGRYAGYKQALEAHGIEILPELTMPIDWRANFWTALAGEESAQRLLALPRGSFTAIFAASDELALGALAELERAGLRVPEHIALAGFDDTEAGRTATPPLTSVRQSFEGLGVRAAELLLAKLGGAGEPGDTYNVATQLLPRMSCGCPPAYARPHAANGGAIEDPRGDAGLAERMAAAALGISQQAAAPDLPQAREVMQVLIEQFRAALDTDDRTAWAAALERALRQIAPLASAASQVIEAFRMLDDACASLAPERRSRAHALIDTAQGATADVFVRLTLALSHRQAQFVGDVQSLTLQLLRLDYSRLLDLAWLTGTPLSRAYLLLYEPAADSDDRTWLRLAGCYCHSGQAALEAGALIEPATFPPPAICAEAGADPLMIVPLCTTGRLYGIVCAVIPAEHNALAAGAGVWAAELATQIELRQAIESLQQSRDALKAAYDHEGALVRTVLELSCPVMPVAQGVLVLPLIGTVDSQRAGQILEDLLGAISRHQAGIVVVDITGVPIVDTLVASHLIRAAQAARLLGAEVVFTGIRPELAQTIVQLGIDTGQFVTRADLEAGLRYAFGRRRGDEL